MSESVAVTFVANALWQVHRFPQHHLKHRGRPAKRLQARGSRSDNSGYSATGQSYECVWGGGIEKRGESW